MTEMERRENEKKKIEEGEAIILAGYDYASDYIDAVKKQKEETDAKRDRRRAPVHEGDDIKPATDYELLNAVLEICSEGGKGGKYRDDLTALFNAIECMELYSESKIEHIVSDFTDTKRLAPKQSMIVAKYCISRINEYNFSQSKKQKICNEIIGDVFERCLVNYAYDLGWKAGLDKNILKDGDFHDEAFVAFREHFDEYNPLVSSPTSFFRPYFAESIRKTRGNELSDYDSKTNRKIEAAKERLRERGIERPSVGQISEESGLSVKRIQTCLSACKDLTNVVRLDDTIKDDDGKECSVESITPSGDDQFESLADKEALRHSVLRIMDCSMPSEWKPALFYIGASMREADLPSGCSPRALTGRYFGISKKAVDDCVKWAQVAVRSDAEGKETAKEQGYVSPLTPEEEKEIIGKHLERENNTLLTEMLKSVNEHQESNFHYYYGVYDRDGTCLATSAEISFKDDNQIINTGLKKGQVSLTRSGRGKLDRMNREAYRKEQPKQNEKKKQKCKDFER